MDGSRLGLGLGARRETHPPSPLPCARGAWEGGGSLSRRTQGGGPSPWGGTGLALGYYHAAPTGLGCGSLRSRSGRFGGSVGRCRTLGALRLTLHAPRSTLRARRSTLHARRSLLADALSHLAIPGFSPGRAAGLFFFAQDPALAAVADPGLLLFLRLVESVLPMPGALFHSARLFPGGAHGPLCAAGNGRWTSCRA